MKTPTQNSRIILSALLLGTFLVVLPRAGNAQASQTNQVLGLDGNSCVRVPAPFAELSGTSFTYEAWVYRTGTLSSPQYIIGRTTDVTSGVIDFYALQNHFEFGVHRGAGILSPESTLMTNVWTHVAAVYDLTNQRISIYVNGTNSAS